MSYYIKLGLLGLLFCLMLPSLKAEDTGEDEKVSPEKDQSESKNEDDAQSAMEREEDDEPETESPKQGTTTTAPNRKKSKSDKKKSSNPSKKGEIKGKSKGSKTSQQPEAGSNGQPEKAKNATRSSFSYSYSTSDKNGPKWNSSEPNSVPQGFGSLAQNVAPQRAFSGQQGQQPFSSLGQFGQGPQGASFGKTSPKSNSRQSGLPMGLQSKGLPFMSSFGVPDLFG